MQIYFENIRLSLKVHVPYSVTVSVFVSIQI